MDGLLLTKLLLLSILHFSSSDSTCYSDNKNPYLSFGPKTYARDNFADNAGSQQRPPEECQPVRLWMVTRPGASSPTGSPLESLQVLNQLRDTILNNHKQGRGELCSKDLDNLKESQFPPPLDIQETTENKGSQDLRDLGKFVKERFATLLQNDFSDSTYEFRYTSQPDVEQGTAHFASGMFGESFDTSKLPKPQDNDLVLDLPFNCDAWRSKMIDTCAAERVKFDKTKSMKALIAQVSIRLGFIKPVDIARMILMYQGCALEKAIYPDALPAWCAVFTTSELKLLEYRDDLFYFRACGPGDDTLLVNRLSCPLVQDMIKKLRSTQQGESGPVGTFYFTDEKSLLILLHGLGLVGRKIEKVETMDRRTFKTSALVPFAANFMAVLYKCSEGEQYQVGYYLGGRLVGSGLHSWSELLQELSGYYLDSLECRVEFCRVDRFSVKDYFKIATGYAAVVTLFGGLLALTPI